ncbi:MAG: tetratricopeptide repeat protein [Arenimonas sp.]
MDPRSQRLWQRGMGHFQQGNLLAAQAAFEAMLGIDPGSGPALFRLSLIQARQGRFLAATRFALRAQESEPDRIELLTHLARCRVMTGQPEAARALATSALAQPRDNPVALDSLGVVLTRLDEQAIAIELFGQAIALQPDHPSLFFNRALAHKQFGQLEAAQRDLEQCIALNPSHGKAHWALAELQTRGPADNHLARLRAQLSGAPVGSGQEELLALSLFKELDDLGRTDEAWPALARGIASRGGRWQAGGQDGRAASDALLRICDEGFPMPAPTRSAVAPVFIVGMPGSGVAMLGRLLSRHSKIHHLGTQEPFLRLLSAAIGRDSTANLDAEALERCAGIDFETLGAQYLAAVVPAGGRQLVCESRPLNFQLAAFIARALPTARFLHITRDPVDNCLSILGRPGGETSLPSHDPGRLASAYLDYRRMMLQWDRLLPGRMMEVGYESLVERPEMILRVVCAFIGLRYGSALRTGLSLHARSIGRGTRYLDRLPALQALG